MVKYKTGWVHHIVTTDGLNVITILLVDPDTQELVSAQQPFDLELVTNWLNNAVSRVNFQYNNQSGVTDVAVGEDICFRLTGDYEVVDLFIDDIINGIKSLWGVTLKEVDIAE